MSKFRHRNLQILVATDVAARGLDVTNLTHIIHYTLPEELEIYTHRSGRTGRKESKGTSIAIIQPKELSKIRRIEKIIETQFKEEPIPSAGAVLSSRMASLAARIESIKADEKLLNSYMDAFYKHLDKLDQDEIIRRFLTLELKRFMEFYKNNPDLKAPSKHDESKQRNEGRGNRNFKPGRNFRSDKRKSGSGFSGKKGGWKGKKKGK